MEEGLKIVLEKLYERRDELQLELSKKKENAANVTETKEYMEAIELGAKSREINKCIGLIEEYCK